MPVTSVNIDKQILDEAKAAFGVHTTKEAIDLALRDAVMRRRQLDAVDALAAIPADAGARTISYGEG